MYYWNMRRRIKMSKELVIHPEHYNKDGRKECWDEMIDKFGPMAVAIFDCLSAYKYKYRAGDKDGNPEEQDMAKITNYMHHSADLIATAKHSMINSEGGNLAVKCYTTMKKEL